jgi:exosome complex component RRP4
VDPITGGYYSTVCGVVEKINKLVFVKPLRRKYTGDVGDVIIGRISEVAGDRWMVEYGGSQMAALPLGGVNLPGSVQRRRTEEDKMQMRELFQEGDVFTCEIQKIMETGEVMVHCRSNKYGLLRNGVLIEVDSCLVRRQTMHFASLTTSSGDIVSIILGNNGWIWVGLPLKQTGHIQSLNFTQMDSKCETVDAKMRLAISKVKNTIQAMAAAHFDINIESISIGFQLLEKSGDIFVSDSVLQSIHEALLGGDAVMSAA